VEFLPLVCGILRGSEMAVHGDRNELGAGKNPGWEAQPVSRAFPANDGGGGSRDKLEEEPGWGSDSWRERLCRKGPQNVSGQPQRTEAAQGNGKATGRLVSAIERLWKEPWKDVSGRYGDPGRELAMLIARRYGGMSLREIGKAVGGLQYPAVSDAVRRTSARLETD
jgi:hypothetical protein